ncbi:MAG: LamG domain-containing protein [Candidatus Binatia bacterium]|nr:LamG domain-containing protein [Candidatus Binatia bacterium]
MEAKKGLHVGYPPGAIPSDSYSIEIYMRTPDNPSPHSALMNWDNLAGDNSLFVTSYELKLYELDDSVGGGLIHVSSVQHLVFTRNDATKQVRVYVDGVLALDLQDPLGIVASPASGVLHFGRDDSGEEAGGFIDYVRIYDGELGPSEVAALSPGACERVRGTLDIHWEDVSGASDFCTAVEYTDGTLADAADGEVTMSGIAGDGECFGLSEYTIQVSADGLSLAGTDTTEPTDLVYFNWTRSPGDDCFSGLWSWTNPSTMVLEEWVGTIAAEPFLGSVATQAIQQVDLLSSDPGTPPAATPPLNTARRKLELAQSDLTGVPPDPVAALKKIKQAVAAMEKSLRKGLDPASLAQEMDNLTNLAREAASDAIADAISRGGDPSRIGRAQGYLADGDAKNTSGEFSNAIGKFRAALKKALSA